MTTLPEFLRRLAALVLLTLLAACGPGTGGTGTGPVVYSGSAAQGAVPSGVQCASDCSRVDLTLEPQRVELAQACRRFVHAGDWSVGSDGKASLAGQVETTTAAGVSSVPATLQLQFSEGQADSAQVTAVVTGEAGVLMGPAVLQRGEGAAGPAPECSP